MLFCYVSVCVCTSIVKYLPIKFNLDSDSFKVFYMLLIEEEILHMVILVTVMYSV